MTELKSLAAPPEVVCKVMQTTVSLLSTKICADFKDAKASLGNTNQFMKALVEYDMVSYSLYAVSR